MQLWLSFSKADTNSSVSVSVGSAFPDMQPCFISREEWGRFCQQSEPGVVFPARYSESHQEGFVYQNAFLQWFPTSEWSVMVFTCVVSTIYSWAAKTEFAAELTQSFDAMYDFSSTPDIIKHNLQYTFCLEAQLITVINSHDFLTF